jgi:hypothetical protein
LKIKNIEILLNNEQGSALVTVLSLITIVTILIGSVMAVVTLQRRFVRRDYFRIQARYLAEAGIYKAMGYLSGNEGRDKFWRPANSPMPLFDSLSCNISVTEWGGFLHLFSKANYKGQTASVQTFIGERMPPHFKQALIVGGVNYPLVVAGANKIVGDVTVGSGGVKPGEMKGIRFSGKRPVNGEINIQSPPQMPFFDNTIFESSIRKYQTMLATPGGVMFSGDQIFDLNNPLNFNENSIVYIDGNVTLRPTAGTDKSTRQRKGSIIVTDKIVVENGVNLGQCISLISDNEIIINGLVTIDEAILFAQNRISVKGNLQGSVQLLSRGDIRLEGNSRLGYPSLIYSTGKILKNKIEGKIEILDQTIVEGTIICYQEENPQKSSLKNNGLVVISEQAQLNGFIYSSNNTTVKGSVYGAVLTGKFFLYQSPTNYINWLKDATIDRSKLCEAFLLPLFFNVNPGFDVLSWENDQ